MLVLLIHALYNNLNRNKNIKINQLGNIICETKITNINTKKGNK